VDVTNDRAPREAIALAAIDPLLREPAVLAVLSVSRTTLWRWIKEGRFPRPVKLSTRVAAWPASVVRGFVSSAS
jgi:prophage regulatory protein